MLASVFSRVATLLKLARELACMFTHSTRVFNQPTRLFKFVFHYHVYSVHLNSNSSGMHCEYVMSSDNSLRVHTSSGVACTIYLSSSNSPVNVRIGKNIRKSRMLILLVDNGHLQEHSL